MERPEEKESVHEAPDEAARYGIIARPRRAWRVVASKCLSDIEEARCKCRIFRAAVTCGASPATIRAASFLASATCRYANRKKAVRGTRNRRAKRDQVIEWNKEIAFRRDSRTRPVSGRRPDPKISIADSAIQAGQCAAYDGFDASRRSMRKQLS
ncbi:hypothetical protein QZM03_14455 [Burkholderia multivorans]|uniref:hypothetical protein n=1 Tax=Burkholderia multivorans TaxID=87883 RepID=UPI0020CEA5C1|nr:hypothetical protein [Burkholderia multivorans]MDN7448546.1 hypothetical protein [Burkholderia multivorans]